jgi:hypothetical protein
MTTATEKGSYRPTESKYKGGASEMYLTYDLERRTHGKNGALVPKVKRVYIAGNVKGWALGTFRKRSGREVHGVRIDYEQSRRRYQRGEYTATRGQTEYQVPATGVAATTQRFSQVVELPQQARNVQFHTGKQNLPEPYRQALQDVR